MFTSKGLFSAIACPHQDNCMLPGCIFLHGEKEPNTGPIAVSNETYIGLIASGDQDSQRKRRRVDAENQTSTAPEPPVLQQNASDRGSIKANETPSSILKTTPVGNSDLGLSTTSRPVSPPPLRRDATKKTLPQPNAKRSLIGNGNSLSKTHAFNVVSTPLVPKKELNTPIKVTLKREALNPRVLKNTPTPASHDMRFRLLRALHDQFNRLNSELAKDANDSEEELVLSEQELITKALDLEEDAAAKPPIYSNVVKNNILVYKRMTVAQWKQEREREVAQAKLSKISMLSDMPMGIPAGSPPPLETGLTIEQELAILPRLCTPVEGLSKHGYVTSIPSGKDIEAAKLGVEAAKGWEVCDRCKKRFQVFPGRREEDGALASGGICLYHFGKPLTQERSVADPKAKRERKYRCCGQAIGDSPGCTEGECHVFKITDAKRLAAILNFKKTPENAIALSKAPVCIDGEMGYTVYGLELIRLTATSWPSGDELFDVLVRPVGEILDLNSRYSGVWPSAMAEAPRWDDTADELQELSPDEASASAKQKLRIIESPAAARELLFSYISPQTPLIGHGLENDLNACRLIHPTLIDTALLFPHKAGLPYRNGLKMLMHTLLNRHIQVVIDGKMEGHDSKEDANAAGELVRLAMRNEWCKMRTEGWDLKDGDFVQPLLRDAPSGTLMGHKASLSVEFLERDPTVAPVKSLSSAGKKRSRTEMEEMEDGEVDE